METAKTFWKNADMEQVAVHWNYEQKTPYEIAMLMPLLADSTFIWDAACGDCRITTFIDDLFPGDFRFLCSDIRTWDLSKGLHPRAKDADTILLFGVIRYLSDDVCKNFLQEAKNKKVIVREPCGPDEHIKVYSDELKADYEAYVRSKKSIMDLMSETHDVTDVGHVYPKNLDSPYGTMQRMFVGRPCAT